MRMLRYLSRQLTMTTVGLTLVLTLAIWLTQSLRFISMIMLQGVTFSAFMGLMLWILPDLILLALPVGFLISVLFVYNKLVADHESVVLKSAGCSLFFFLRPILWIGSVGTLFLYLVSLYLLPLSLQTFREKQVSFRSQYSQAMIHEGEFNTLGGVIIYADRYEPDGLIQGLFIYDNRNPSQPVTVMAQQAFMMDDGENGLNIVLLKGNRQMFDPVRKQPSLLQFEQYVLTISPEIPQNHIRKPYEMFLSELLASPQHADQVEQHKRQTEIYQRFLMPFYVVCFGVLAGLFMMRAPENRLGRQKAMFLTVGSAFAIEIGSLLAIHSAFLGRLAPVVALLCVGFPFLWLGKLGVQFLRDKHFTRLIQKIKGYSVL